MCPDGKRVSCESGCPNPASSFHSPFPILVAVGAEEPRGDGDRGSSALTHHKHVPWLQLFCLLSSVMEQVVMSWESPGGTRSRPHTLLWLQ